MKRYVEINLDKKRRLLLNMRAVKRYEEISGKGYQSLIAIAANMKTDDQEMILWAMLKHEDKKLTLEQVKGFFNPHNVSDIYGKIIDAMFANMPENSEDVTAPNDQSP